MHEGREKAGAEDVAIIRIEQLYPFPQKQLSKILKKYKNAKTFNWVQEEPENMGAWSFILRFFREVPLTFIGRHEGASPATGYSKAHALQQQAIVDQFLEKSTVTKS